MPELRSVACDVDGCKETFTEARYGDGYKGWGKIYGRQNPTTGADTFYLCPKHLDTVFKFLESLGANLQDQGELK